MKSKKKVDLVAGRLGRSLGSRKAAGRRATGEGRNYGADRLGLEFGAAAEPAKEGQQPETPSTQDARSQSETPSQRQELQQVLDRIAARATNPTVADPPDEPTAVSPDSFGLGELHNQWRHLVVAAASALLLCVLLIWVLWPSGSDSARPQTASAANPAPQAGAPPRRPMPAAGESPAARTLPATRQAGSGIRASRPPASPFRPRIIVPSSQPKTGPDRQAATPARPTAEPPEERYIPVPSGFTCTGIMRLPQGRLANINGSFLAVGESVSGARVVEVRDFVVIMELDGNRFLLPVGSGRYSGPPDTDYPDADDGEGD